MGSDVYDLNVARRMAKAETQSAFPEWGSPV
jgi:hypothetical protein